MPRLSRAALTAALAALALLVTPTAALAVDDPPPAPVTGLSVSGDATSVTLAWTLPTDADLSRVVVRRKADSGIPPAGPTDGEEVASGLLTTWTDPHVDPFRYFSYAVFAQDSAGQWSAGVGTASRNPTFSTPLTKSTSDLTSVSLSWSYSSSNVAGLRVFTVSCADTSRVEGVVDVARPTTTYRVGGLARGQQVCLRSVGYGSDGRGGSFDYTSRPRTPYALPVTEVSATPASDRIRLSWTLPDDPEVAGSVVTRTDVTTNAAPVEAYRGTATTFTDTGLTPEHTYSYAVRTTNAAGDASDPVTVRVRAALHWARQQVAPVVGSPAALDCARTTWCMSLDANGRYQVLDGSTWSSPRALGGTTTGLNWVLSCPVAGWCLASDSHGVRIYSGGHWSAPADTPQLPSGGIRSLDCVSSSWCAAVVSSDRASVWNGSRWTTPVYLSGLRSVPFDVACRAEGRCVAVGYAGTRGRSYRATLSAGRWSTVAFGGTNEAVEDVECPTSTRCVASGATSTWTSTGGTWTRHSTTWGATDALSCASGTLCVGVDPSGRSVRWDGSRWSRSAAFVRAPGVLEGLDCPTGGTTCHAVDDRGRWYRWTASAGWRFQRVYDETSGGMGAPSCTSATECLAIDANGWLHRFDGSSWSRPSKPFVDAASVGCSSSGFCLGLQATGRRYRTYQHGAWSTTRIVPMRYTLGEPSCASSSFCVVFDDAGEAWRLSGTTWTGIGHPFTGGVPADVRCTSSSFCMAVSSNGRWSRWTGTRWTARSALPAALRDDGHQTLDCSSSTQCLDIGLSGATAAWSGTAWRQASSSNDWTPSHVLSVDCASRTWCLGVEGVSNSAGPLLWDGTQWITGSPYPARTDAPYVACPTTTSCVASGDTWATWTVPVTTTVTG